MKTIQRIVKSQLKELGAGLVISSPLPTGQVRQASPFLMLDHLGPLTFEPGRGFEVGAHPHCGFEPVTFLFEGEVEHKDSAGNHGLLQAGDVQWMTAGRGIIHSEASPEGFKRKGGRMHLVQLWVNLPKAHKKAAPGYQDIKAATIPNISTQEGVVLRQVAGGQGPAKTFTPIVAIHGSMEVGKQIQIPIPTTHQTLLYVLSGEVQILMDTVKAREMAIFNFDGDALSLRTKNEGASFLLLAGEPINEPMVSYGPFVVNEASEIARAVWDYETGKMGRM